MNDKRLLTVAELLPAKSDIIADIGTDHGKLGAYLLETGRCDEIWFSDISAPSLDKARQLSLQKGFGERAKCFTGSGALPLPGAPSAAVIAGMGGNTISMILEEGAEKLRTSFLVLQPNTHIYETRLCLMGQGYEIVDERICEEAGRLYTVISAAPGRAEYSYAELMAGPVLLKHRCGLAKAYAERRLMFVNTVIESKTKSGITDTAREEAEKSVWESFM